jgi:hypothetical protein
LLEKTLIAFSLIYLQSIFFSIDVFADQHFHYAEDTALDIVLSVGVLNRINFQDEEIR